MNELQLTLDMNSSLGLVVLDKFDPINRWITLSMISLSGAHSTDFSFFYVEKKIKVYVFGETSFGLGLLDTHS